MAMTNQGMANSARTVTPISTVANPVKASRANPSGSSPPSNFL